MAYSAIAERIIANNIFDCDHIDNFINSIVKRMTEFKGTSSSQFYICQVDSFLFLTKLCLYPKSDHDLYAKSKKGRMEMVDTERRILEAFHREFIKTGITNCIVDLIHVKVCQPSKFAVSLEDCEQLVESGDQSSRAHVNRTFCIYAQQIAAGLALDKCMFMVLERCDVTFTEYIADLTPIFLDSFKAIMFQIIYTIFAIKQKYPRFQHNDLHTSNVLLHYDHGFKAMSEALYSVYTLVPATGKPVEFYVEYLGLIPKIIDFGFSVLPEEGVVSKFVDEKHVFTFGQYPVRDVLRLLTEVYSILSGMNTDGQMDPFIAFLDELDPSRTYRKLFPASIAKTAAKVPSLYAMLTGRAFAKMRRRKPAGRMEHFTPVRVTNLVAPVDGTDARKQN